MAQCNKCPIEVNSYGILACKLTDDDVAKTVESDLLNVWGFHEELLRVSYSAKRDIHLCVNSNDCTDQSEITAASAVKKETAVEKDNTIMCVSTSDECCLSATGDEPKSVRELYEQALVCYRLGQVRESLVYIDDALKSDVMSLDQITLITFKAKVLNSMVKYVDSLRCIANVSCENRSKEILVEGAIALDKLDLHFTAEEWLKAVILDRSEEPEGLPWTKKAFQLFQDIRNRRIYGPLIGDTPLTVSLSKDGRGLYAKTKIIKGEIFSELPEFSEKSLASTILACGHCGMSLAKPEDVLIKGKPLASDLKKAIKRMWPKRVAIPCQICNKDVYCSELCRNHAWHSYHKVICPSSPNSSSAVLYDVRDSFKGITPADGSSWQGWWNAEFNPVLMARIWAEMLVQVKLRAGDRVSPTVDHWLIALSQGEKYSSNCQTLINNSIPNMFDLMKNIFKRSKVLRYEITDADFNKKYHKILTNYISFQDVNNPIQHFLDKIKHDGKLKKKLGTYFQEPLPNMEHHGLFALASCINHSCIPNAEILSGLVNGKPGIIVTAKRDIDAEEEILVSYVNPDLGRAERRDKLLRRYKFWCQCLRCTYEGDGSDKCTECGKVASCTSGIQTSELSKDIIGSLQRHADTKNSSEMQVFSERFESLMPSSLSLNISSNSRGDSKTDSHCAANLEDFTIKQTDLDIEGRCEIVNRFGSDGPCSHCSENVSCGTVLESNVSKESTQDLVRKEAVERIMQSINVTDNEAGEKAMKSHDINTEVGKCTIQLPNTINMEVGELTKQSHNGIDKEIADKKQSHTEINIEVGESTLQTDYTNIVECKTTSKQIHNSVIVPYEERLVSTDNQVNSSSVCQSDIIMKFPHCARCGRAWYCSQKCQKNAWKKGHKKICMKYKY